ncbi:MAG: hypothetical protein KC442_05735, partial [Thermomicrobiales bacterium]|nr:hypothetical protein [Thermomicrobiales bacterium]
TGIFFLAALLLSPSRGLLAKAWRDRHNRDRFAADMLVVHLFTHEDDRAEGAGNERDRLGQALRWTPGVTDAVISRAERWGLLVRANGQLALTDAGRVAARDALAR